MGAHLRVLPDPACAVLVAALDDGDLDSLYRAGVVDWRRRSSWQARLPVELVQHILGQLPPASFYVAGNCVCALWRRASRSVTLLRRIVRLARELSATFRKDLGTIVLSRTADVDTLWNYFLVAAPLKNHRRRERPHRVSTISFRAFGAHGASAAAPLLPPRVFASDYAGVLAVAAPAAIYLYSVDKLRSVTCGSAADPNSHIAMIGYPPRLTHDLLLDVSIAHQTSDSRHLVLFAVFDDPKRRRYGLLYRCDIYYVIRENSQRSQPFTQVNYTPLMPVWDSDWGFDAIPDKLWALFHRRKERGSNVRVHAIEPPHPCATAVALRTNDTTYILLFDVLIDSAGGRGLSPFKCYKAAAPIDAPLPAEGAFRDCAVNPTRLLFAMSPGKHRRRRRNHAHSSERSYPPMSQDKDAVVDRESFLEWFSELCWPSYSSVLKSLDGTTHYGVEFCENRLVMCKSRLTHHGLIFSKTRVELALPLGATVRPSSITALCIAEGDEMVEGRGTVLVAACWDEPSEVHLYEVLSSALMSRSTVTVNSRRLAYFQPAADAKRRLVTAMRFYGGVSSWRGIPCDRAALLVVIMAAGFVHVCQLATGSQSSNYYTDWGLNAVTKLRTGVNHSYGWHPYWTVQSNGHLTPS